MSVVKEGKTKDGTTYVIRHPEMGDVESAWRYINRISEERTFISFQGEQVTLEEEEKFIAAKIKEIEKREGTMLFVIIDGEMLGECDVKLKPRSEKHVGVLGLTLDASVRGQGLGRALIEATLQDAATRIGGLEIIVLTVKAPNDIAHSLYTSLGFQEFGVLPNGTKHRDELVDEIYMYKKFI